MKNTNISDIACYLEQVDGTIDMIIDNLDDEIDGIKKLMKSIGRDIPIERLHMPLNALRLVSNTVYDLLQECDKMASQ